MKHLLGLFEEAVLVYKSILEEHCDYVPALKGTVTYSWTNIIFRNRFNAKYCTLYACCISVVKKFCVLMCF